MNVDADLAEALDSQASRLVAIAPDIAMAVSVFLAFIVLGWVLGRGIRAVVRRRGDRVHANFLAKLPIGIFGFVGLMVAVEYLGLEKIANGLLAGGGVTAIIIGFAFREIGENFLAGLFLAISRPFRLGDLIQSGARPEGVVMAVDLRNTHVRTADGRDLYIPNARVFNEPLVNFTRDGLRRPTFRVGVDYRMPIEEVRAAILERVAGVQGVLDAPAPRVEIVEFPAANVLLEVQVWIDTFEGADYPAVQTAAMEACRRAILDNDWTISSEVSTAIEIQDRRAAG